MAAPVPLRPDFDVESLRALAKGSRDPAQTRRLLAVLAIYAGRSRSAAAALSGVGLQTVRDWVVAFNAHGPDGLVGGTGTGKTHLAIAIGRACIRDGKRGRFYNVVDLVNRLEAETRAGRQGRIAEHLKRLNFLVLDELGFLPFAQ